MKKLFTIILIIALAISITVNFTLFFKLSDAYERIDKYLHESYVHMTSLLNETQLFLEENPSVNSHVFSAFCKKKFSINEKNSGYNYAMRTRAFKWHNDQYYSFSLDTIAIYFTFFYEQDIPSDKLELYRKSLNDLCVIWNSSKLGTYFSNDKKVYPFIKDPKKIAECIENINQHCNNFMDSV